MAVYAPESTLTVRPFTKRSDGDEVIITDADQRVFLAIPTDGLDILESLATGRTVGETVERYRERYHETPDIDEFLDVLVAEGFVSPPGDMPVESVHGHVRPFDGHTRPFRYSWSLDWISPGVARRLASTPVLIACLLLIAAAVAVLIIDPGVWPPITVFLFLDGHFNLFTMITFVVTLIAVYIHELAHAVVARAAGVRVRVGFGNLLFSLVAQTDVSGLWMASKRRRYLAYVSGVIVDAVFAAILIFVLYADRHGAIGLPPVILPLLGAILITYQFRLLFQTNFSIRTDVYYLIADAFNCRDLMADTEALLRNLFYRLTGRSRKVADQSSIPARERKVVRGYAVAYIVGRLIAFGALFFLFVPVLFEILAQFALLLVGGSARLGWADFLTVGLLILLVNGGGIFVWLRGVYQGHLRRRALRRSASAAALAE